MRKYTTLVRHTWAQLISGRNGDTPALTEVGQVRAEAAASTSGTGPQPDPSPQADAGHDELRLIVNEHEPYVVATWAGRKTLGSTMRDVAAFFREEAQVETLGGIITIVTSLAPHVVLCVVLHIGWLIWWHAFQTAPCVLHNVYGLAFQLDQSILAGTDYVTDPIRLCFPRTY